MLFYGDSRLTMDYTHLNRFFRIRRILWMHHLLPVMDPIVWIERLIQQLCLFCDG